MLWSHFKELTDPRVNRTKLHLLSDIITITICGIICGSEGWEHIEEWAHDMEEWLSSFLTLPHGIPSHDTLRRVFISLNPQEFQECFLSWTNEVREKIDQEVISLDGKTLRRSHHKKKDKSCAHIVSAWANENEIVLGQVKVDDKSNEITALPTLLQKLYLQGCIVTIDAMGCQKKIAEIVIDQEANYVLALKENHPTLYEEVTSYFDMAHTVHFTHVEHDYNNSVDKGHGRIEEREYWITEDIDWLEGSEGWRGLKSIGMVRSKRILDGVESIQDRFYLCSIPADAKLFAKSVRQHWCVENKLHWCLDVQMQEDLSRIRDGYSAENFAVLRHIALNLLKKETSFKKGIKAKQLKASRSIKYLEKVITG